MIIVVVGGGSQDERRLKQLVGAVGFDVECRHVEWASGASAAADGMLTAHVNPLLSAPRALVIDGHDEPEHAMRALAALRRDPYFDDSLAIVAVKVEQVERLDGSGFDDFVLHPFTLEEIQGRVRALERRRHELESEGRRALEGVLIDQVGHEVSLYGRTVPLTAKEFALLAYLCERRGQVLSREHLLARVWGTGYEGGARTVDVHVRRLRRKLGTALTIETVRGNGYKLRRRRVTDAPPPSVRSPLTATTSLGQSYAE